MSQNKKMGITLEKKPWLILVGPTAVGKTAIAEQIAWALGTDIIVADSRQVYQGMDIATNKPNAAALQKIKRHLINLIPPDIVFSAGAYKRATESVIATLGKEGKPILIEGGTGLYIKALLYGLAPPRPLRGGAGGPATPDDLSPWERLEKVDPVSAQKIHFRDLQRIGRALNVYDQTGQPLSSFHAQHRFQTDPIPSFVMMGLRRERAALYRRIEERVDQQFQEGLLEETRRFMEMSSVLPSMRALGYKQVIPYLQGTRTLDEAISLVKRDTRHYAKRQMTWFSADKNIRWIDLEEGESPEETALRIQGLLV